ncbi:MAG: DUF6268 family outer membrane beta-barrel protein [Bacteroidales bacterium]|nr:DUF6268 family outer membrane beta-barrel protein [Bacteroidales bacterium]
MILQLIGNRLFTADLEDIFATKKQVANKEQLLTTLFISVFLSLPVAIHGQGYISTDYLSSSSLVDDLGNKYGSGNLMMVTGRYTLPLSTKLDDKGRTIAWAATLNCVYGKFNNQGVARYLNPDEAINAGFSITHMRPISERWSILASLGCGIYAEPNEISFKSLLANGSTIFVYNLRKNLQFGFGFGLTNSYGVPMILPIGYLNWHNSGKYEISINLLSSGVKVSASTWLHRKFKIEAVALEMDGLSAVMNIDGKSKIYSTLMMRTYISPSFYFTKQMSVFLGIGANWMRSTSISERSFNGFFNSFSSDDNTPNLFKPSLRLSAGIRYRF